MVYHFEKQCEWLNLSRFLREKEKKKAVTEVLSTDTESKSEAITKHVDL